MATIVRERYYSPTAYSGIYWIHRVLNALLTIVNILLVVRLILKALSAGGGFSNFVYSLTEPLVAPFAGIVSNTGVFEWSALIAIIVWSLVVVIIEYIVDLIGRP